MSLRTSGWVGENSVDQAVVDALEAFDPMADFRWIPGPDLWEAGWWWEPSTIQRAAAHKALESHLDMPVQHQSAGRILSLHQIVEGWRPAFAIPHGRNPTTRDVNELRKRDWIYRHSFDKTLAELEEAVLGDSEETRDTRISRVASELTNDEVLYGLLTKGRHSVLVPGLKQTN